MFKYGSIRFFLIKFTVGLLIFAISILFLGSLLSYDSSDPGFNNLVDSTSKIQILNYFGGFGAYTASYLISSLGYLSYIFSLFILIISVKLMLGLDTKHIFIKFISNISGIVLLSSSMRYFDINFIEIGFISIIVNGLAYSLVGSLVQNKLLLLIINLILLIFSIYLITYSFSLKIKFFKKIFIFLGFFKYLKYFNPFKLIIVGSKNLKPLRKKRVLKKSEPTINKNRQSYNFKESENLSSQTKPNEMGGFKFKLPDNRLLVKSKNKNVIDRETSKINKERAIKLEKTLAEYGVEGSIVDFKTGPIVTLFEFIPSAGIKSSKIIGLSDDIARAMSSYSARISSQPGKTSLGIEIPNAKRESVMFGDLVDDDKFELNNNSLTLALGKNIAGEKVYADLEKMPHLLIAGTTGSGKSVGINTMILSLLFKFKPNECKLILIDPKMLELSIYEDIPHLLTPVVTDPKKAVFALKWVVREMENRYKLMSSINVKNIVSYNKKVGQYINAGRKLYREVQTGIDNNTRMPIIEKKEIVLENLPYIVVVIDEMADLMMVAGKEVESLIQRLAQMARASGIHLITATQRPSVDVITGTIKANFPSRISYKVASKFDSRTILNEMGSEQLLGSGDMLFLENGAVIKRLHGGFVSESEVENVVSAIKSQVIFDQNKQIDLVENEVSSSDNLDLMTDNTDELYGKAVEIVIKQQKVSTSYIQRYLQIGYNRAARIVEKMEEDGVITEPNNAGKRHVLKKE